MIPLLIDVISNIAIITTLIFFSSRIFKKIDIYSARTTWSARLSIGLVNGLFGIFIMFFSVSVPPSSMFDLRQVFILVAASLGGLLASLTAGLFIQLGRIVLFGGITSASITSMYMVVAVAVGAGLIFEWKGLNYWAKWTLATLLSVCSIAVGVWIMLPWETAMTILLHFIPAVICGELFAAYLVKYVTSSNQLFLQREEEATTDHLTQVNNVRSFDRIFNEIATNAEKKGEKLSLLMIDIDHFKQVNDKYGHPAGDLILKELAKLLRTAARSFDIVSRNGGEEFSILLPDCPNSYLREVAERVRMTIENTAFPLPGGVELKLTVSVGGANYPAVPLEGLIEAADKALYMAKHSGRNCVRLYVPEESEKAGVPARS
ncbi:GGDEF domain-containing protein [Paenibacillus chartarius]|uniref:GGDEF domain-containing protein n=1 Tax=Paenibacillus chartarius TaxID=747481 RepID=A0ABV6DIQ5_9BACL